MSSSTSTTNDLPPGVAVPPDDTYPGRVFLFTKEPEVLIASGYDLMAVERRKRSTDPWVEITKPNTRIPIVEGTYNYSYLDEKSKVGYEYQAVLLKSVDPLDAPISQGAQKAVDVTYESLLTIQELIENYLFGQEGVLTDDSGTPFPDSVYAHYIQAGIAKFEQRTSLKLLPTRIIERQDFFYEDYYTWQALHLDEYPVICINDLRLVLPGTTIQNPSAIYPESWIALEKDFGQVHIVPDGLTGGPVVYPGHYAHVFRSSKFIPQVFYIDYFAGFELGKVPRNLIDMVGKEASAGPLNLGGDLVGGAGIASQSISMDGLSTNINTTSSATNAAFGARLIQYNKELKEAYPDVIRYFKGGRMTVV